MPQTITEPRFDTMELHETNIDDLQRDIDRHRAGNGRLVAIVDERAGGIVAYVIDGEQDLSGRIAAVLSANDRELDPQYGLIIELPGGGYDDAAEAITRAIPEADVQPDFEEPGVMTVYLRFPNATAARDKGTDLETLLDQAGVPADFREARLEDNA